MNQPGSFIPRQAPVARVRKSSRSRVYVFSYIAYVVFFTTLLTVIGLFLWGLQLNSALASEQKALDTARDKFKPADIETVRAASARLGITKELLDSHPAFSRLTTALAEVTAQSIQLQNFNAVKAEGEEDVYVISFTGRAPNFSALLFQRGVLEQHPFFKEAKVTDMKYSVSPESLSLAQSIEYTITLNVPVETFAYTGEETASTPVPAAAPENDENDSDQDDNAQEETASSEENVEVSDLIDEPSS